MKKVLNFKKEAENLKVKKSLTLFIHKVFIRVALLGSEFFEEKEFREVKLFEFAFVARATNCEYPLRR